LRGHRLGLMDIDLLRTLYPTLTEDELKEAKERLERYFAFALCVAAEAHSSSVDKSEDRLTIKERSNRSLKTIPFEHG
jgi:hypothetical protein